MINIVYVFRNTSRNLCLILCTRKYTLKIFTD